MTLDRSLAATGLFPLILGGHDHDPYLEVIIQTAAKPAAASSASSSASPSGAGASPTVAGGGGARVATRVSSLDKGEEGTGTVVVKVRWESQMVKKLKIHARVLTEPPRLCAYVKRQVGVDWNHRVFVRVLNGRWGWTARRWASRTSSLEGAATASNRSCR
jgi:hypothetical protein